MAGQPDPKSRSLVRGERRYRRKVAGPRQWQKIIAEKRGPCRVCVNAKTNGFDYGRVELHHLVARAQGGDDVAENIVPLHARCHWAVTLRHDFALAALAASLTDSEYAYVVGKLGESGHARLFGVKRGGI